MHACIHSLHYLGSLEGGPTKMNHHDPFFKLTTKLNKINYLFCCDCAHIYIYILSFIIQSNTKITCNDAYKQILNKIIHNGKNIKFNKSSERKKKKTEETNLKKKIKIGVMSREICFLSTKKSKGLLCGTHLRCILIT